MTSQRTLTTRILTASVLLSAVLTVLFTHAASAQQMASAQRPAKPSKAFVPTQASAFSPASLHPLSPEADDAKHFATSGPSLSFLPPLSFDVGGNDGNSVVVADVNKDGKADLIVTSDYCGSIECPFALVSVLLGNGDGTFQPAVSYDLGGLFAEVGIADVNEDGKLDIVASAEFCLETQGSCVNVLLGNADGPFQPAVTYNSGGFLAASVAAADVNGDGKPDIVVANNCSSYTFPNYDCNTGAQGIIGVLLGNGDGTFQPVVTYSPGGYGTSSIAIADVNGDGKPDLIITNQSGPSDGDGSVGVLLGNGNGTFQPVVTYDSGGQGASSVAVADVNGDGRPDLLVANSGSSVGVLLANSSGTFQPAVAYDSGGQYTRSIAVADVNGDGNLDVAVASYAGEFNGDGVVGVLLGNGNGTFQPVVTYDSGGYGTNGMAAADVNGDGKTDILTANQGAIDDTGDGLAGVLLNNTGATLFPSTTLLFSSLNPSSAGPAVTFTAVASSTAGIPPSGD